MLMHSEAVPPKTNYPLLPEGICFQLIDGWLDFSVGNAALNPISFTYFGVTVSHSASG